MNFVYIILGVVLGFILFVYLVNQLISALLISVSNKPLAEDQKEICKQALAEGKSGSRYCKTYIKKGRCGSKTCDIIK